MQRRHDPHKNDLRASGFAELQNGGRLGDVTVPGDSFVGPEVTPLCKSGGSEVIFVGIMAPLHPSLAGLTYKPNVSILGQIYTVSL